MTGTANVDFIFGFDGTNIFTGGLGNDVLIGGYGADKFNIDAGNDQIINFGYGITNEIVLTSAGASVDASFPSSWSWQPTAASINSAANTAFIIRSTDNVVNLSGITSGNGYTVINAGYQNVVGSIKDDILIGTGANSSTFDGGTGNDVITGGPGSDNITLGGGNDILIFNSLNGNDNIADYSVANDSIQLSKAVFTALTGAINSAVGASEFVSVANVAALAGGSVAASTNAEQLIYVVGGASGSGELYYNADGATAGGLTLIGKFTGSPGVGPGLVASEFTLIA